MERPLGEGRAGRRWDSLRDLFSWRHPNQLIASSRLVLAAFALIAVYVDPTQPARFADVTYLILAVYTVLSALLLATSSSAAASTLAGSLIGHAVDISVFAVLMYLTAGPTSPFFVFFTFAIVSGALRWGAAGATWTATILLTIFLSVTLANLGTPEDPDLNRVILRSAYLLVASVLLAYFGAYRQRSRDRLARLAAWPQPEQDQGDRPALEASLRHAAPVLEAKEILVLWQGPGDAWWIAHWTGSACEFFAWDAAPGEPLVASSLENESFMARSPDADVAITARGPQQVRAVLLMPGLARSFGIGWFSTAPFKTAHSRGRVFILGPRALTSELLSLTEIVANRIGFEFEHFQLRSELAEAAAMRERTRLARDMHDSILQEMTAAGLQLKVMSDRAPPEIRPAYAEVMRLLSTQQRRLREFVTAMNPKPGVQLQIAIAEVMERTAAELARQWRCRVVWEVRPDDAALSAAQALQLQLLTAEGVANAVRHGKATEIEVSIELRDALKIEIRDDGAGRSPQAGDPPTPFSLSQRVEELGGSCRLTVGASGASLTIQLPTE